MRGIIELPLEKGKKELCWYVGTAIVQGTSGAAATNPTLNLTTSRDADFVAKRWWLVQWPTFTGGAGTLDPNLALPADTSVILREGSTKRALQLVSGFAGSLFPDANPNKFAAAQIGLEAPYLVRANTNLLMEIARPSAAGTAWGGDILFVMEGFKVYPYLPEDIPATIKQYGIPFNLNGNGQISSPAAAGSFIAGQRITISNDGSGKFLAKRLKIKIIDAGGVDRTAALLPCLGFNFKDSTSGDKHWIINNGPSATAQVPVSILSMGGTDLFFNTPRYIDPNGVVTVEVVWSDIAAAITYVAGAAAFPVTMSVSLGGTLLPS